MIFLQNAASRLLHAAGKPVTFAARRRGQIIAAEGHRNGNLAGEKLSGVTNHPKSTLKKITKTMPYDIAEQLRTPEEMAAYLDAWLDETPDDAAGIARALGVKLHAEAA